MGSSSGAQLDPFILNLVPRFRRQASVHLGSREGAGDDNHNDGDDNQSGDEGDDVDEQGNSP